MRKRRSSTIVRDNVVHSIYDRIMSDLGELRHAVSKLYIYDLIKKETSLSTRTIAFILNHTSKESPEEKL